MSKTIAVRVDDKGRMTLPAAARRQLGITAGATVFVLIGKSDVRVRRGEDPFAARMHQALEDDDAGLTRPLREYAAERGITVDAG